MHSTGPAIGLFAHIIKTYCFRILAQCAFTTGKAIRKQWWRILPPPAIWLGKERMQVKEKGKVLGGGLPILPGAMDEILSRGQETLARSRALKPLFRGTGMSRKWKCRHVDSCLGSKFVYNLKYFPSNGAGEKRIDSFQGRLLRQWSEETPIWLQPPEQHVATESIREAWRVGWGSYRWSYRVRMERARYASKVLKKRDGADLSKRPIDLLLRIRLLPLSLSPPTASVDSLGLTKLGLIPT